MLSGGGSNWRGRGRCAALCNYRSRCCTWCEPVNLLPRAQVGSDKSGSVWRLLKFDKTTRGDLDVHEDPTPYTKVCPPGASPSYSSSLLFLFRLLIFCGCGPGQPSLSTAVWLQAQLLQVRSSSSSSSSSSRIEGAASAIERAPFSCPAPVCPPFLAAGRGLLAAQADRRGQPAARRAAAGLPGLWRAGLLQVSGGEAREVKSEVGKLGPGREQRCSLSLRHPACRALAALRPRPCLCPPLLRALHGSIHSG